MSEAMSKRDVWTGRHRGVAYEVSCHYRTGESRIVLNEWSGFEVRTNEPKRQCWAHYIYLHEGMIPAEKRPAFFAPLRDDAMRSTGFRFYDYYKSALADLEWHGGITFYDILHADQPGCRTIKAGCDYQHSWDDGCRYTAEVVEREASATIDSLHANHPDLLVCDWYDGTWHPKSECEETPQGWLSPSGRAAMKKWDDEAAQRAPKS